MKRIVQCPKCQVKLSVLDIGKPINQKCPKCGESFVVESEEAKSVETKKEPTSEAAPVSAKADDKADVKAEPKSKMKDEAKAAVTESVTPKPAPKPATPKPAAEPLPATEEHLHHSGVSFLHIVVIMGLLLLVVVLQVMAKKNMEKRFSNLESQLSDVHKALSSQILKSK